MEYVKFYQNIFHMTLAVGGTLNTNIVTRIWLFFNKDKYDSSSLLVKVHKPT